jgi:hypothetical protein
MATLKCLTLLDPAPVFLHLAGHFEGIYKNWYLTQKLTVGQLNNFESSTLADTDSEDFCSSPFKAIIAENQK